MHVQHRHALCKIVSVLWQEHLEPARTQHVHYDTANKHLLSKLLTIDASRICHVIST